MSQRRLFQLILFSALCLALSCQKKAEENAENAQAVVRSSFASAPHSLEPLLPAIIAHAFERSCKSCQGPEGHGIAAIAPDMHKAAARTVEQWTQYFTVTHPGATVPPPAWINADEIIAVANYLATLNATNVKAAATTDDDKGAR